jgi:hypothetical protein
MVSFIIPAIRAKPVAEQVRLLGSIRQYVKDDGFVNIMQNYDYNNKRGDVMIMAQLAAYTNVPGLREEIGAWLSS